MLDEKDFQRGPTPLSDDLKRRMLTAGDEHGFASKANPETRSPLRGTRGGQVCDFAQHAVREIWVSALSTSFKLAGTKSRNSFIHEKPVKIFRAVMSRVISSNLEHRSLMKVKAGSF